MLAPAEQPEADAADALDLAEGPSLPVLLLLGFLRPVLWKPCVTRACL